MDQASPTARPPQSNHVEWEDIEDIANQLFHVWMTGGDLAWAKIAWRALSQAGMTAHASEAERTICVVRLIALNALYREFCVRAFDEGDSDEWQDEITTDLVGDYPLLDVFTLGQLAERRQIDVDNSSLYESDPPALPYVILELIREEYCGVVETLQEQWDENAFFTSLYASAKSGEDEDGDRQDEASSPVTEDQIDRVMNSDLNSGKDQAHAWFKDGLPL
jgi:hypothetical protein